MSPIEYIENGIKEGNWDTVCLGYKSLTGKSIKPPASCDERRALLKIKDIVCGTTEEQKKIKNNKKNTSNKVEKKIKNTVCVKDNSSELVDSNIEYDGNTRLITNDPDPKEVSENIMKANIAKKNKAKLKRHKYIQHDVICNECDKTFKSARANGEMGQKCKECLSNAKSRFV